MPRPKPHRITVNFSDKEMKNLTILATRRGKTPNDILREGLALEKFVQDVWIQGGRVAVQLPSGDVKEITPK